MGKVEMVQGRLPEAIAVFEGVNPNSDRYSNALYLAAQTHFRLYLEGKAAPPDKQDQQALAAHRDKSIQELITSIDVYGVYSFVVLLFSRCSVQELFLIRFCQLLNTRYLELSRYWLNPYTATISTHVLYLVSIQIKHVIRHISIVKLWSTYNANTWGKLFVASHEH